jgi:hypothetical protein
VKRENAAIVADRLSPQEGILNKQTGAAESNASEHVKPTGSTAN